MLGRLRPLEVHVKQDDGRSPLDQAVDQPAMHGTRPVPRQGRQPQSGNVTLVDGDHRNFRRRLDGTADQEQPVQPDVLFKIHTRRRQRQQGTGETGGKAGDQAPGITPHVEHS